MPSSKSEIVTLLGIITIYNQKIMDRDDGWFVKKLNYTILAMNIVVIKAFYVLWQVAT